MVRDCRKLHADLTELILRGDVAIVAKPLVEVAATAALVTNALELPPKSRTITDALARELDATLAALDVAVSETLALPVSKLA